MICNKALENKLYFCNLLRKRNCYKYATKIYFTHKKRPRFSAKTLIYMAHPIGFEPMTSASGGQRFEFSIK